MTERIGNGLKTWWVFLVLGILVLILGGNLISNPIGTTLVAVSLFVGIFFLVTGVGGIIYSVVSRKAIKSWVIHLIVYIIVTIMGLLSLTKPAFAVTYLWLFFGLAFILEGVSLIFLSLHLKKMGGPGWVICLVSGILMVIFSLLVLGNPIFTLTILCIIVGINVILFGIELIVFSFQVKPTK